jgi:hypothetical protein
MLKDGYSVISCMHCIPVVVGLTGIQIEQEEKAVALERSVPSIRNAYKREMTYRRSLDTISSTSELN